MGTFHKQVLLLPALSGAKGVSGRAVGACCGTAADVLLLQLPGLGG